MPFIHRRQPFLQCRRFHRVGGHHGGFSARPVREQHREMRFSSFHPVMTVWLADTQMQAVRQTARYRIVISGINPCGTWASMERREMVVASHQGDIHYIGRGHQIPLSWAPWPHRFPLAASSRIPSLHGERCLDGFTSNNMCHHIPSIQTGNRGDVWSSGE